MSSKRGRRGGPASRCGPGIGTILTISALDAFVEHASALRQGELRGLFAAADHLEQLGLDLYAFDAVTHAADLADELGDRLAGFRAATRLDDLRQRDPGIRSPTAHPRRVPPGKLLRREGVSVTALTSAP